MGHLCRKLSPFGGPVPPPPPPPPCTDLWNLPDARCPEGRSQPPTQRGPGPGQSEALIVCSQDCADVLRSGREFELFRAEGFRRSLHLAVLTPPFVSHTCVCVGGGGRAGT